MRRENHTFHYASGSEKGVGGVGIVVSNTVKQSLIGMTKVNDRILILTLNGNPRRTAIACYAPTETASKSEKDDFYDKVVEQLQALPKHYFVLLLADLNARVGADNQ